MSKPRLSVICWLWEARYWRVAEPEGKGTAQTEDPGLPALKAAAVSASSPSDNDGPPWNHDSLTRTGERTRGQGFQQTSPPPSAVPQMPHFL